MLRVFKETVNSHYILDNKDVDMGNIVKLECHFFCKNSHK